MLAGECLLLVEGEERPLRAWDFVHCPPGTEHIFVGAGDGPCVIFMAGARDRGGDTVYLRYEVALRHGAGVERETRLLARGVRAVRPLAPGPPRAGPGCRGSCGRVAPPDDRPHPHEPRRLLRAARLADRPREARERFPPRVRARELWRVDPRYLEEAQDDATLLAIRDQERAGLDIVTDGEMRRESYSNRFATALEGVDLDNPGTALDRSGHPNRCRASSGRSRARHPVQVRDLEFLSANTEPPHKITVPGPVHHVPAGPERLLRTTPSSGSPTPPPSTRRSTTSSRPAPTSCSSTSPTCRRGPRRRASTASPRSSARSDGVAGTTACTSASATPRSSTCGPRGYSFLTELARRSCDQISIETAQSNLDARCSTAAGQDDHPRRARPLDGRRSRRPRPWPGGSAARCPHVGPSG